MKKILLSAAFLALCGMGANAQRTTDKLSRGLVAVKTDKGVFCSWRITAEEYYDVKYNIYRDGTKLNAQPLEASNFTDANGSAGSTYTVEAVVRGVAQTKSPVAKVWEKNYKTIVPKHDPSLTSTYVPNDACCADVDGDGELEILMKYDNQSEISASYPRDGYNGEYSLFECLKQDGTVLWWVNCGPNMGDFQNNEQNIIAFDWDKDGKAEAVFRAADGTTIHMADGTKHVIGDASKNYRAATGGGANWFMHDGAEYLVYVNGQTGKPYQVMDYPLKRLEEGETNLEKAWGDGYGHRSTKHFFGAPFLDGRNASIFLARGIYTRHKMIALDVNPATHELVERWRWNCNDSGSAWFGQGYHNYGVADVDWDGRDEIVFGSMVIDDNGHGLSTTGLGHGDSQHCSDFDPYTHGQEIFACNEDNPNNNFRDATTSKIYYRTTGGNDDGRANMGNFLNDYPGAQGVTSRDNNLISAATHTGIVGDNKSSVTITQNFRIYWDGDLCEESFDYSNGKNTQGAIFKARQGRIALLEGSKTNNDTKGTPCYQGDLMGDWREEVMMRDADNNIRIYTTDIETPWRNYSLWHDHQYRNAMVWQMCGYNQTPHTSYFLGELEGITKAPAPLTMTGRTEVANGATIGSSASGKHMIMCETGNMTVNVADGAAPYILTVNAPTWVQGHDSNSNITTEVFTHTITGGAFAGEMRLVKQGDGILTLPNVTETYSGETDIWAGTLNFDGTLQNSPLWLNRFAVLNTNGGRFMKGMRMDYASEVNIGTAEKAGTMETTALTMGFGSRLKIDIFGEGLQADMVKAESLTIEKKDWTNGPQYLAPVIELSDHNMQSGRYLIAEVAKIEGSLDDLIVEGMDGYKKVFVYENGKLYLDITVYEAGNATWTGSEDGNWDIDGTQNFVDGTSGEKRTFVPGDDVTFDDKATTTDVTIAETVAPGNVIFNNESKNYTINGESILSKGQLTKNGAGCVTLNNVNTFDGGVVINGGKLVAGVFANNVGTDLGALGDINTRVTINNGAALSANESATLGQPVSVGTGGGTIEVANGKTLTMGKGISGATQTLTKTGAGTLALGTGNSVTKLVINGGTVQASENSSSVQQWPSTVELRNGTMRDADNLYSYSSCNVNIIVPEKCTGNYYLDGRCDYKGKLTGAGSLTVYARSVRNQLQGNWSDFEGTVTAAYSKSGSYDPDFIWDNAYGLPKATLSINSGVTVNAGSRQMTIGNIKGAGELRTTGNVTIGGRNETISYTGTFAGMALTKTGDGEWKVTKALGTPKSVTVNKGLISLPAAAGRGTPLPDVSAANTITLTGETVKMRGQGTVASISVQNGAVLEPGYYSGTSATHYGQITATKDVNVAEDGVLSLYINNAPGKTNVHSSMDIAGKMTLNGTLKVGMSNTYSPSIGDEFTLWTAGSFDGTPKFELPALPAGMAWDSSALSTSTGVLKVVVATAVENIPANEVVRCDVYTIKGVKVGTLSATRANVEAVAKEQLSLAGGTYIVRMTAKGCNETIKIIVR